ncbi:MAG: 3'-5' exonuclease [Pleopsidium flavum]|nr:MAG: 3'-5' exonuclease [Pleopsidium flavum]
MEFRDLSSNWKKLQKTLQPTSRPPKRKASEEILQPQRNGVKRRKAEGNGARVAMTEKKDTRRRNTEEETAVEPVAPPSHNKLNEGLSLTLDKSAEAGRYLALDCEMVGVGSYPDLGSVLARVSIVNYHGVQVYDSFVQPKEFVTDWRTAISGITPSHMRTARSFEEVQTAVAGLLDGKILVGHAVKHDLEVLMLGHPKRDIRDTSRHPAFRRLVMGKTPGLKRLAAEVLGVEIQSGEHSSVEDARACMLLFQREKDAFEVDHAKRWATKTRLPQNKDAHENGKRRHKKKKAKR